VRWTKTGEFRHRITLQKAVETQSASNAIVTGWADLGTVWAKVTPLEGRERLWAQQVDATLTHRVSMRYLREFVETWAFVAPGTTVPADTTPVGTSLRVKYGSRYLYIKSVIDIEGCHRELALTCAEAVS